MVAVMDFNVPDAKIKSAVDIIVNSVNGEWLDDTPVPTARAKVGGGDRLFAIVPGKRLLVVLPFEAKDQLEGLKKTKGSPTRGGDRHLDGHARRGRSRGSSRCPTR